VLITYYNGETAGRTFHDYAGVLEVLIAFGAFFALDRLLSRLPGRAARPALRAPMAAAVSAGVAR
jgi:hypothetical protein